MITLETNIKRIDLQGVWNDNTETLKETHETVLNDYYSNDSITIEEYETQIKERDISKIILEIVNYSDIYEFEFVNVETGKPLDLKDAINIKGETKQNETRYIQTK